MVSSLTSGERTWIAGLLLLVSLVVSWDLVTDFSSGSSTLHLITEGILALAALVAAVRVWGRYFFLKHENVALKENVEQLRESEQRWRQESALHVEGLSKAIDDQFSRWALTPSEKEVALLLLKGLSLKEVATVRGGSERTARQHSLMVYQKSGLKGRAELSAFFLEDLLTPIHRNEINQNTMERKDD